MTNRDKEIKCEGCGMVMSVFNETSCVTWHGPCDCVESDPKETHLVTLDTSYASLTKGEQ